MEVHTPTCWSCRKSLIFSIILQGILFFKYYIYWNTVFREMVSKYENIRNYFYVPQESRLDRKRPLFILNLLIVIWICNRKILYKVNSWEWYNYSLDGMNFSPRDQTNNAKLVIKSILSRSNIATILPFTLIEQNLRKRVP